jgi:two-component system sensor histidine kinase RegB
VLLCCLSYASLFVPPPAAVDGHAHHAHHAHHILKARETETSLLNTHLVGMWWAFAVSAGIAVFFLTRLAQEIRTRDHQLRLAEEQRERYTRLASMMSLTASAAHELGTPLGTIAVVAKELERELPDDLKAEAQLVRREVDRCRRILDRLSARSGELVGERPEPLDLQDLAARVVAELPADYQARLDVRLGDPAALELPPQAFAVAVANLIMNGFEASPPDARVGLTLEVMGSILQVEVHDRGAGLGDAQLPELFDPFVTTKAERGGLGLGLYVVRVLMESLDGTVVMRPGDPQGTVAELRVSARAEART